MLRLTHAAGNDLVEELRKLALEKGKGGIALTRLAQAHKSIVEAIRKKSGGKKLPAFVKQYGSGRIKLSNDGQRVVAGTRISPCV